MTRRIFVSFACVCAVILALAGPASAEEEKGLGMIMVEDVVVHPSGVATYEKAVKELMALWKAHEFPYPVYTYSTDNMHYYLVFPVESLGEVEELFAAWDVFVKEWGQDKLDEFDAKWAGAFDHYRMAMYSHRPDLSYEPNDIPIKAEDGKYFLWGFCDIIPGYEKKAEALFKQFSALYTKHEMKEAWRTWQAGFGADLPGLVYMEWGSSPGQFWTGIDAAQEKVGEEVETIWLEFLQVLRGYHYTTGTFRPELSHLPAQGEEAE
ncbi:MAG: hypothetical protein GY906_06910 [bacterium]|nr:hypothetical protein [bacterium]